MRKYPKVHIMSSFIFMWRSTKYDFLLLFEHVVMSFMFEINKTNHNRPWWCILQHDLSSLQPKFVMQYLALARGGGNWMQLACFPISELWRDDRGSEIKWQLISFVQTESITLLLPGVPGESGVISTSLTFPCSSCYMTALCLLL